MTADVVALEARKARKATDTTMSLATTTRMDEPVTGVPAESLTVRRLAHRPADTRPIPSIAAYDSLLRRRTSTSQE